MEQRTDLKARGGQHTADHSPERTHSATSDLVVVSAFGRGNWLASELAGRGWNVTLIDVSGSLGEGEPEEAEGPFGLFESADLLPSQKNFFQDAEPVRSGFTVWLGDGPLECRSELTEFQLKQKSLAPMLESYLRRPLAAQREARRERGLLKKQPYKSVWLAHLAHQVTSPLIAENQVALESGAPAPLFSSFAIRHGAASGWKNGLRVCEEKGVKVIADAGLKSIGMHGRGVDRIEISDSQSDSRMIGGRTFVWLLSSAETEHLSPAVSRHLYPRGPVSEDWFWARYQVELGGPVFDEQIPPYVTLISDLFLPWTHANLMILRKRSSAARGNAPVSTIDVWLRLPAWARKITDGDAGYFAKIKTEIEHALVAKIPFAKPRVTKLPNPQEGPVRFPIFTPATLRKLQTLRAPNLFFCTVEQARSQDWLGHYRLQNTAVTRLEKLKALWVAAANRQAMQAEKRARRAAR